MCLFDHYLISKERVDISPLDHPNVHSGCWNLTALVCHVIGNSVEIPSGTRTQPRSVGRRPRRSAISWPRAGRGHRDLLPMGRKDIEPAAPMLYPADAGIETRETRQIMIDPVVAWTNVHQPAMCAVGS